MLGSTNCSRNGALTLEGSNVSGASHGGGNVPLGCRRLGESAHWRARTQTSSFPNASLTEKVTSEADAPAASISAPVPAAVTTFWGRITKECGLRGLNRESEKLDGY